MERGDKETFKRLLRLIEEGDKGAFPEVIQEAIRRGELKGAFPLLFQEAEKGGEVGGDLDLPFRLICSITEQARRENNGKVLKAIVEYSRYMYLLWESLSLVTYDWEDSNQKGPQEWVLLVEGGKWHQLRVPDSRLRSGSHPVRCGVGALHPQIIRGPIPLSGLQKELESGRLCGRCLTAAQKNWAFLKRMEGKTMEECSRIKCKNLRRLVL